MRTTDSFKIRVADFVFEIHPMNPQIAILCKDYLTDDVPDVAFTITPADIAKEEEYARLAAIELTWPDYQFSEYELEYVAVSRKIAEYVSLHHSAMFHGALIEKEGKGYLFTAPSGTGKTTHIMNWCKVFDDVIVVNGDKQILRWMEDGFYAYGTPWCGKENLNTNKRIKLEKLIILERAEENHIERASYLQYMNQLFMQLYVPQDPGGMQRVFALIRDLSHSVELYRLGCNMDASSAITAYEGMNTQ